MELTKTKYKETEVGLIPEDWKVNTLGNIAFVTKLAGFEYSLHFNSYKDEGDIIVVRGTNITHNKMDLTDVKTIPIATSKKLPRSKLFKNDLVFAYVGTIGPIFLIEEDDKYHLGPNTAKISVEKEVNSKYLYHYFTSSFVANEIFETTSVGAQPSLSMSKIRTFKIITPSLTEQKAIATALSDADDLIANLDKLITKKKAIKQGAMQQLLTPPHTDAEQGRSKGGKRLAGFTGEWVECELQSLCDVLGGGTPSTTVSEYWNGGINWFTPTEIGLNKFVSNSKRKISALGLKSSSAQYLPKGTILLTTRASIGDVAILQKKGCTNQGFQSLIPKESHDSEFLYQLILTKRNDLMSLSSGSTFLEISPKKVKSLKVCVPKSINERNAIAHVLSDLDKEIEKLESKKAKYQDIKQGMMQELLTGKTRLI
jgi:type I restriction enzyme S subunit